MASNQPPSFNVFNSKHFKVINGDLVQVPQPQISNINYRYIPYTPLNKPNHQDYFRATIDQLLKQNVYLREKLNSKGSQQVDCNAVSNRNSSTISEIKKQLEEVSQNYSLSQASLKQQRALAQMRENQCKQLRAENMSLHNTINQLVNQLQKLKNKLSYTEQESMRINSVLQKYDGTLHRLSLAEKIITENTELSEMLSKSEKKFNEDEFKTVKAYSHTDSDQRFMTPKAPKDQDLTCQYYKNRSVEQKKLTGSMISHIQSKQQLKDCGKLGYYIESEYLSNRSGDRDKNWQKYATPNSNYSAIQMLDEYSDPVAGSLSLSAIFNRK